MKKRFMTYAKNHKGVTLVLMAFFLVILLIFASLAIDIAYMYYTKNQLQVAADAAALAGAALLHYDTASSDYLIQSEARKKAIEFAAKNKAAGEVVTLITNNTNTLSDDNDITVGNWNPNLTPQYLAGRTPINAIEVKPKRYSGLGGSRGPVRLFLGSIFTLIGSDWTFMSAGSYAVASKPPRASSFVAVGNRFCPLQGDPVCVGGTGSRFPAICNLVSPRHLEAAENVPPEIKVGWTSLLNRPGSTSQFETLMCTVSPYQEICGSSGIWGIPGITAATFKDYESLMCDPSFDSGSKTINAAGRVTSWEVIIPIVDRIDPMSAPDPNPVWGYAKVRILQICAPGSAGCRGAGSCFSYGYCGGGDKKIVIDRISCIDCDSSQNMPGLKPSLVR